MQEKNIQKVALITSLLGIMCLFFYAGSLEIPTISSLESIPNAQQVQIEGVVTKLLKRNTTYFIQVQGIQPATMDIIVFPDKDLDLQQGMNVQVQGMTEEYKGKKEVIADKIVIK